ncbi:hypothetical protein BH10BAC4_BH10BAC4_14330 [soil metagenome]
MLKKSVRILRSNWTHLIGFYLSTYLFMIFSKANGQVPDSWGEVITTGLFWAGLLFYVYGISLIGWFYLAIITIDMLAFSWWRNKWITETLIIEWLIIITPFIYWAFKYEYWLWIALSASLLATQVLRGKTIRKILSN